VEVEMIEDRRVDGNAIGGLLADWFGREMTGEIGCCGECGVVNPLGAVLVYLDAPGQVIRCPACSSVLMVVTTIESTVRMSFEALRWIQSPR
jgi:hypothetical protein